MAIAGACAKAYRAGQGAHVLAVGDFNDGLGGPTIEQCRADIDAAGCACALLRAVPSAPTQLGKDNAIDGAVVLAPAGAVEGVAVAAGLAPFGAGASASAEGTTATGCSLYK